MSDQRIGSIVDSLGVELDLDDGDLIASAVILAKVVKADGTVALGYGHSEGMCWIEGIGLITSASDVVRQGYEQDD